jgi:hypothetical protein
VRFPSAADQSFSDLVEDFLGSGEGVFVGESEDSQTEGEEKGVSVAIMDLLLRL